MIAFLVSLAVVVTLCGNVIVTACDIRSRRYFDSVE